MKKLIIDASDNGGGDCKIDKEKEASNVKQMWFMAGAVSGMILVLVFNLVKGWIG